MLPPSLADPPEVREKEPEQPVVPPHFQPSASGNCMKDVLGSLMNGMTHVFLVEYKTEVFKLMIWPSLDIKNT